MALAELPSEIIYEICKMLPYSSCKALAAVNRDLSSLMRNVHFKKLARNKLLSKVYDWIEEYNDFDLAVQHACDRRNTDGLRLLLSFGVKVPSFILLDVCKMGNAEALKVFLEDQRVRLFPEMLWTVCEYGWLDLLDLLLRDGRLNPADNADQALIVACVNSQSDCVRRLLEDPRVSANARNDFCFRHVCQDSNHELIDLFLANDQVNPGARDDEALIEASASGNLALVQRLLTLPRVHPEARDNFALRVAAQRWYVKIAHRLWRDPRVKRQHMFCYNPEDRQRIALILSDAPDVPAQTNGK